MADEREQAWQGWVQSHDLTEMGTGCKDALYAGYDAAIQRAEQAEAMVLALRECLSRVDRSWEVLGSQSDRVLADTAAGAEAVRKRIELEGARKLFRRSQKRWRDQTDAATSRAVVVQELAALEAEHA